MALAGSVSATELPGREIVRQSYDSATQVHYLFREVMIAHLDGAFCWHFVDERSSSVWSRVLPAIDSEMDTSAR